MDEVVKGAAAELRVYVVWEPILPDDDAPSAARAARGFADPRVTQYWDPDRTLGLVLGERLGVPPRDPGRVTGVAWDVYLLFGRGARWADAPALWMNQLDDVPLSKAPKLDGAALRERLRALPVKAPPG
jgi:hypothetical protein